MKKRLLCIVLVLILLTSLVLPADAVSKEEFNGTRSMQVTADWSDLENYINGGRTAFDQILRGNMPEWFMYKIHTQGRDVTCTFSFSFTSFEDYQKKLTQLIMRTPAILYSREDSLLLLESCKSFELLNFLEAALNHHACLSEKTLQEIFRLTQSSIEINGKSYDASDSVCIRPENQEEFLIDELSVKTETRRNYGFSRTITAQVKSGGDADALEAQFSQAGNAKIQKAEKTYQVSVSFDAASQAELVSKTMAALNSPTFISEQQKASDNNTVTVERTEFFDLDHLLREGGSFTYTYVYPSYCDNLISENGSAQISASTVTSRGESFVVYTYQRKLQFRSMDICTDLSSPSGKITRSITCTLPLDIAEEYHSAVTDRFKLNLVNGSVMDIYDEDDKRIYKISFSSFLHKEIEEFTAAILNDSSYKFKSSVSLLPYAEQEILDSFQTDDIISRIVPTDEITATYILPNLSRVSEIAGAEVSPDGSVITFRIRTKDKIHFQYQQLNMISLTVLMCAAVLLILILIFAGMRKKTKRAQKRARQTCASRRRSSGTAARSKFDGEQAAAASGQPLFCGNCGVRLAPGGCFCQNCGARIER